MTSLLRNEQLALFDGWIAVKDTWAYASASTITVPTDATLKYEKGMALRWKQGGAYKYGVIKTVAATLITIIVNTDFVVANSAITDVAYSMVAKPFGFPHKFKWLGVLTSGTGAITSYDITTGLYQATYEVLSKTKILLYYLFVITNNGTGATRLDLTLPVPALTAQGCVASEFSAVGILCNAFVYSVGQQIRIYKYDNTYPGGTNYVFQVVATMDW